LEKSMNVAARLLRHVAALAVAALGAGAASGATLTVTNTLDAGAGSLRDQIAAATAGDTIVFDAGVAGGTVVLTSGQLDVDKSLTIDGTPGTTVARSGAGGTPSFRIFDVSGAGTVVTLTRLTISGADSASDGGGILNRRGATLTVTDCVLSGNAAGGNGGGGIANLGTLTVDRTTFAGNAGAFTGGGLLQIDGGSVTVANSTFTGNSAQQGAAVSNQGITVEATMSLVNCTVSGNCTVADNTGTSGGITTHTNAGTETITYRNCVVSGNTPVNFTFFSGTNTSLGNNVSSDGTGGGGPGDLVDTDPLLGVLASHGGPTQTRPLLPGSPAIDGGSATGAPVADQRGFARLGPVDVGAFESRGFTITVSGGSPQSATILTAFPSALVAAVASSFGEPVAGGVVGFEAPAAGASASFPGDLAVAAAAVDGSGLATAPAPLTANAVPGSYVVVAAAAGAGSASFSLTNLGSADLSLTKAASPDPVSVGGAVTYTLAVTNAGPTEAEAVSLSDALPAGTTFLSLDAPGWSCVTPAVGGAGTVTCTTASMPVGPAVLTLVATAGPSLSPGAVVSNTATVSSTSGDPNPGNESATATTAVISPSAVSGTKTVTGSFVPYGGVTYTITLVNAAPSPQTDAAGDELVDVLPPELELLSASASSGTVVADPGTGAVTWNGAIPGGGTVTITIAANVRPATAPGTVVSNQAEIRFDADGDGTNEATAGTGATAGVEGPTTFRVLEAIHTVPALGVTGLGLLGLLVAAAGALVAGRRIA